MELSSHHDQWGGCQREEFPLPPTMVEVLAQIECNRMDQTRILEQIARNTSTAPGSSSRAGSHHAHGGLMDFQQTNPPVFSNLEDPMEAKDWLRNIENKMLIAQCSEKEKVLFTSYKLDGAASAWWDNFYAI